MADLPIDKSVIGQTGCVSEWSRQTRRKFCESLTPLNNPQFRFVWLGSVISSLGDAPAQIALFFAVLHLGGTASAVGIVAGVQILGRSAFLPISGVWADRLPRQYAMIASDLTRGAVQATIAVLLIADQAHIWELGVGGFIYGVATSFFDPASTGLVPETVSASQLQQANSLLQLPLSVFVILGPGIGGVLIALFGTGPVFAVDAGSFMASALALSFVRVPSRRPCGRTDFWSELALGWHEVVIRTWYWTSLLAHACWNFGIAGYLILGPILASRYFDGPPAWGMISAFWGVGEVAGGVLAILILPRKPLVTGNFLLVTGVLPLLSLAFFHNIWLVGVSAALASMGVVFLNSAWTSSMEALIPDRVRSRAAAYDWLISLAIMPIGLAVMGPMSEQIGVTSTLLCASAMVGLPCVLVSFTPWIRSVSRNSTGAIFDSSLNRALPTPDCLEGSQQ